MGGYAWVTLATNDSYSLGALVLAHSLRKSNTAHKLVVLITPTVSQPVVEQLKSVFDLVETVLPISSNDEARLALMKRPELGVTFTKIHCWKLTQFEKCVFLDADTFVVRNCDELFEREEFSAAPDVGWPDCFNSGVFVYKPSEETFNKLNTFASQEGSFDGGDQGLLNQFFSNWATEDIKKHLPFVYNLTSVAVYSYLPAFRHYGADTRIVHFIGTEKPWLQFLDPVTRTVVPSPGSEHLAPFLQQWWDLFCDKVHPTLSKNQENNNDGMHPPVEACSNTPVALTSDEPQPPRLIEPCLQYIDKDDYRQHNLPYQPFVVRGLSGESLNVEFFSASVVPSDHTEEQQRRDDDELEEKDTIPLKLQEESNEAEEKSDEIKPDIVDEKTEEKQEEPPAPKDPFDYNTFFPDENCVNNYLEQNAMTYQPHETVNQDSQHTNIPLPRFLTLPEDDQRQKGNIEGEEHQPLPEESPPSTVTTNTTREISTEFREQPTPPSVERHELQKSKSMTFISGDIITTELSSLPQRSIWKSQPNVNVNLNRKYSMPKLKPLLPRQNSKPIQSPVPRVTLYTEFLMSADYKDPVDLPKDEVGFVVTELRRSKSESNLKGKFGPLPYIKSPEVKVPEPKKTPLRELENDAYDLTRCKRQLGNKPRDLKKENIASKLITPSKEKVSTLIKKRKSKELSPGDGGKEKPPKKGRKEHRKRNENLEEILQRLWDFSKNYQHYFGVQRQMKDRPLHSEFKQFRNFVEDQKQTTQKGLLGIKDIMTEKVVDANVNHGNVRSATEFEPRKIVNGLGNINEKNTAVKPNSEIKTQKKKHTRARGSRPSIQSLNGYSLSNDKHSVQSLDETEHGESDVDRLTSVENVPTQSNDIKTSENEKERYTGNVEHNYIPEKYQGAVLKENSINQNGWTSQTINSLPQNFKENRKVRETSTQTEKSDNDTPETIHECINLPKTTLKSPAEVSIPEKIRKDTKLVTDITNPPEATDVSTSIIKEHEKISADNLRSQIPTMSTSVNRDKATEDTIGSTTKAIQINLESPKIQKDTKIDEPSPDNVQHRSELDKTESCSKSLEKSSENKEVENDKFESVSLMNNNEDEVESEVQSQEPSEKLNIPREDSVQSKVQMQGETRREVSTKSVDNTLSKNGVPVTQKTVLEKSSSPEPIGGETPKGMFTIGSPEKSPEANEKDSTQPKNNIASNINGTQTLKVIGSILQPDEILCVPDFDTPRSSRIITPVPSPDVDVTPQAPPSSPIIIPRKARIQRKPYENGTKYRSTIGKKAIKTGSGNNSPGIAGAIAKLKLKDGGEGGDSNEELAAQQEYIRKKNWETGNIDYMGKDSFENIWSKICQTLEGQDLDKAGEITESLTTISTEEKTKPERAAGTEEPVSLSMIIEKCPDFIDALPSEPPTGPVEEDEIIFSKPETRQKCLTNIKEEEETGSAPEGISLSDILKPKIPTEPVKADDKVVTSQSPIITPAQLNLDKKSPEEPKSEEKPQAPADVLTPKVQEVADATIAINQAEQVNEPVKPQASASEPVKAQSDEIVTEIKPSKPECTTVAVRQPLLVPGAPCENQELVKTPAQKIAEKKLQQKPETSAEPIPLPAPDLPGKPECKTVAILHPPVIPPLSSETQTRVEETSGTAPAVEGLSETSGKSAPKEGSPKKGVFSKLLEMVGVAPKTEDVSKSVFYDLAEATPKTEGPSIEPNTAVQELIKEPQPVTQEAEPKKQELESTQQTKADNISKVEQTTTVGNTTQISSETKESKPSIPEPEKPTDEGPRQQTPDSGNRKPGQAPMPKPARNASPKSCAAASKNKSPSPITIPQPAPETELTMATPTPPPEPPKRRNSALLKVDESIPATPPVPEAQKASVESTKSEVEGIIEKAKTEVESILQDRRSVEPEAGESSELINTMKLMVGAEAQGEVEELKVTSEEERQRHKGEVVSSKLSDQILKAIPPPRRKAISESKSEGSGSSGAIPKTATASGEKPKPKPSSIPVPPPRNKGKPSTPAPTKGKTKK